MQMAQQHLQGELDLFDVEFRFRKKTGDWIWIMGRGVIVERDEKQTPLRFVGTHTDITDRKRAEERQARLQAQLVQAQKMESIGRLAGGMAHDFNNMLGVILGHAELALRKLDPAQPLHADIMEIRRAGERSAELTRNLLAFARKQTVAPKVLDLNETLDGMLVMLQRLIGEDIELVWNPNVQLWPVKIDPSQIDQILVNLCVNARDAIAENGQITIETDNVVLSEADCLGHSDLEPGDYVMLYVADDGCGMESKVLEHVFDPFFTTKGKAKGTGLGLSMVFGIVKQNRGHIHGHSRPGEGTTFKIYLPRFVGEKTSTTAESYIMEAEGGNETILLVEDEPAILDLSRRMLEKQGYQVVTASTPGEAIRLAQEHVGTINLLMTDVVMPEMNGRELAKRLLSIYPDLKRLFMSGYTADVIAHHGVLEEGVHFLQKPFTMVDLGTRVREALDQ
jgi:signal transduction histidine kinase